MKSAVRRFEIVSLLKHGDVEYQELAHCEKGVEVAQASSDPLHRVTMDFLDSIAVIVPRPSRYGIDRRWHDLGL